MPSHNVPLLEQLSLRRCQWLLVLDVEESGRKLPQTVLDRVPILPDDQHLVLRVDRHHRDCSDVVGDLSVVRRTVVVDQGVESNVEDVTVEDFRRVDNLVCLSRVSNCFTEARSSTLDLDCPSAQRRLVHGQAKLPLALEGGRDKPGEQRMRSCRT